MADFFQTWKNSDPDRAYPVSLRRCITASNLSLVLGVVLALYIPVQYAITNRQAPRPGQSRPVIFFSSSCHECKASQKPLDALIHKQKWVTPVFIDSNVIENDALRIQFDNAFKVKEIDQGVVPAVFFADGFLIGEKEIRRSVTKGIRRSGLPNSRQVAGYPWTRFFDLCLAGILLTTAGQIFFGDNRKVFISTGLSAIILIFLVSGASKIISPAGFVRQIETIPLLHSINLSLLAYLVGATEVLLCLALAVPRWRQLGSMLSVAVTFGFSIIVLGLMVHGYQGSCGCFPWQDRVGWWTLVRDLAMLLVCVGFTYNGTTITRSRMIAFSSTNR